MEQTLIYGIRHIPTGDYLPVPKDTRGCGRGGSHVEPADPYVNRIRVFTKEGNAKRYLAAWLNGKYYCHRYGSGEDYEEEVDIIPQPNRIKSDMEIVPLIIREDDKGLSSFHVIRDITTGMYMPSYKESWDMRCEYSVECNQPDPVNAFWFVKHLGAERYLKQWRKGLRKSTHEFFDLKRVYEWTEVPERINHDVRVLTYSLQTI